MFDHCQVLTTSSMIDQHQSGDSVVMRNKKRCRVLFSYQPVHDDELELKVDQVLEWLGEVEDGWWKGRSEGRVGVFPSNFVEMCTSDEKTKLKSPVDERKVNSVIKEPSRPENTKSEKIEENHRHSVGSISPSKDDKKMSTSQRSQIGQSSPPPDTAPRLPPKPGNIDHHN